MTTSTSAGPGAAVLAFDVGGTDMKAALLDEHGRMLESTRVPTPLAGERTGDRVVEEVSRIAEELTAHDALAAHLEVELHIDQDDLVNPWHAALSSAVSFTIGAILPMLAILLVPAPARIAVTFIAVLVALAFTGTVAAQLGGAPKLRAMARLVIGGALALIATFLIGMLLGTTGIA